MGSPGAAAADESTYGHPIVVCSTSDALIQASRPSFLPTQLRAQGMLPS